MTGDVLGITLYYQIEEAIRKKIFDREWPEGYQLPSEPDLAAFFGVSRSTIRQAIGNLINSGFLERKRGRGTFVTTPSVEMHNITRLLPEKYGKRHKLISARKCLSTPAQERYLNLKPQTQLMEIVRARYIYDEELPCILERAYYPCTLFPGLETLDLSEKILYDYISNKYNTPLLRAKTTIEPVHLRKDEVELFQCDPELLAQLMVRVVYTCGDSPVILTVKVIRSDRFKLCVQDTLTLQERQ